jgi:hypothetical protein
MLTAIDTPSSAQRQERGLARRSTLGQASWAMLKVCAVLALLRRCFDGGFARLTDAEGATGLAVRFLRPCALCLERLQRVGNGQCLPSSLISSREHHLARSGTFLARPILQGGFSPPYSFATSYPNQQSHRQHHRGAVGGNQASGPLIPGAYVQDHGYDRILFDGNRP